MGDGGYSQFVIHCPCHSFLLTLFPCSRVGSLPQETDFHEILQYGYSYGLQLLKNCSNMGPSHGTHSFKYGLLQCGFFPQGQKKGQNICYSVGSSSKSHGSCQKPAPAQVLHEVTACLRHIHLLWCGMDCRGTTCITMVFTMDCRGISALLPGALPPPPALTLVSAELFVSHLLTLFFQLLLCSGVFTSF